MADTVRRAAARPVLGIWFLVLAVACFAVLDTTVKYVGLVMPVLVAGGFAGALLVVRPGGTSFGWVGALLSTAILPMVWQSLPDVRTLGLLCLVGLMGTVGHFLLILAFARAPASTLTPASTPRLALSCCVAGSFPTTSPAHSNSPASRPSCCAGPVPAGSPRSSG